MRGCIFFSSVLRTVPKGPCLLKVMELGGWCCKHVPQRQQKVVEYLRNVSKELWQFIDPQFRIFDAVTFCSQSGLKGWGRVNSCVISPERRLYYLCGFVPPSEHWLVHSSQYCRGFCWPCFNSLFASVDHWLVQPPGLAVLRGQLQIFIGQHPTIP